MIRITLAETSTSILRQNRAQYVKKGPGFQALIDGIDQELARRENIRHYVLTATGQFEHMVGERVGFTACGVEIDLDREYGDREWWHCLSCERAAGHR